jgi:hypothetical protein
MSTGFTAGRLFSGTQAIASVMARGVSAKATWGRDPLLWHENLTPCLASNTLLLRQYSQVSPQADIEARRRAPRPGAIGARAGIIRLPRPLAYPMLHSDIDVTR